MDLSLNDNKDSIKNNTITMEQADFQEREEHLRLQIGEEVLDAIDDQVYADPFIKDSIFQIRNAEAAGRPEEAAELVAKNRDLVEQVRIKLLRASGVIVNLEEMEDESEKQRKAFLKEVSDNLSGEETEDELLQKFQLLDEAGKLTPNSINSPLFRKRTSMAFKAYISSVKSHMDMVDYMQVTGDRTTDADAKAADSIRTKAHDTVSREVAEDLGIEFEAARSLVAKMRDDTIPKASEKDTYATSSMRVGQKLSENYKGRTAWLLEDKTKIIFSNQNK